MTNLTTSRGRLIMAVTSVLAGLFMMFAVPFLAVQTLNPALHSLVEVFQVQQPNGVWDTPVPILNVTYHVWIGLSFFGGAALLILAKYIWLGEKWARPVALGILAIPSIGGMTMTIPWTVLVMRDAFGTPTDAGMPPALIIMTIGLIAYYIVLLTEKAEWRTKVAQIVVFTMLGVVAGFIFMNAQHGVRFFLGRPSAPFIEGTESNPQLFLGGFVLYAASILFPLAIGFLAARKRQGWHLALLASIVTFAAQLITYFDRVAVKPTSSVEWMKGSLLSLSLLIILLIPFFKNRLFDQPTDNDPIGLKDERTTKAHI